MIGFGIARAPATILFGAGQRRALGRVARLTGGRALICTDARFSATEDFSDIVMNLRDAGIATLVYDGTQAELPVENVHNCVALARGFRPDMVVGIGGGSCLDLAKLASLLLSYPGDLADYYGELKVPGPVLPVLALPTTSGTGSECTPVAVVGDSARALKVGVSSPHLVPHAAICDPELTLSCPPILTAITGADAMTHAVEAFTNLARPSEPDLGIDRVFVGKNRISDTYALAAIAELAGHLVVAVEQGEDLEARAGVMLGAMYAGLAFGTAGTAAAHAIQYPVGALTHTAHGLGVAVLLPPVMRFNRPACTESFAAIARTMGVAGHDENELADAAIQAIDDLFGCIGIPKRLSDLNMPADRVDWVAEQSMLAARLVINNPRPLDVAAMKAIVKAAL